ncbi:MAG TPA: hypothetical protein VNZ22_01715, partial [Bacillota bacterium]|nr:hypothetical protein [Bacillota bacterium]
MKDNADAKAGPLRKRDEPVTEIYGPGPEPGSAVGPRLQAYPNGHPAGGKIDGWTVIDVLLHRWHWLVLGGMLCAGLFYLLGSYAIKPKFTASAQ